MAGHDWMPVAETDVEGIASHWEWCTKCGTLSWNKQSFFKKGTPALVHAKHPIGDHVDTGCPDQGTPQ